MIVRFFFYFVFFFSSRRRHTRWPRDWSSDVCSSDLHIRRRTISRSRRGTRCICNSRRVSGGVSHREICRSCVSSVARHSRSEERREGKSVDSGGRSVIKKKNEKKMSDL